jgi:hypothetical protein
MVVQSGSVHAWQAPVGLHAEPVAHKPHDTLSPHPSGTVPHVRAPHGSELGAQHAFATHLSPGAQAVPHATMPPHPSGTVPQLPVRQACAAVFGVQQALASQTCVAPHLSGHATTPPQPSATLPQAMALHSSAAVCGLQHAPP